MLRRPPRSTPTDTLFPYTTLFRADPPPVVGDVEVDFRGLAARQPPRLAVQRHRIDIAVEREGDETSVGRPAIVDQSRRSAEPRAFAPHLFRLGQGGARPQPFCVDDHPGVAPRSDTPRVGKAGVSSCSTRGWPD